MIKLSRLSAFVAGVLLSAFVLSIGADPARAQQAEAAGTVRTAVETWLKGRYKVDEVRKAPVPGMWEVRLGNDLIYVDEKGQYAFVEGQLVEMRSNRNLTRERVDELMTINFKDLPLNLAIKQVIGNGKRVVAVFEDPNCGYCKKMRMDLVAMKDITIYTFPIPILAADSEVKSRKALCADDKVKAWNDMMISGKVPSNPGTCDNALGKLRELAQKLGMSATPTAFFQNGTRLQGYVPGPQFDKMLDENTKS